MPASEPLPDAAARRLRTLLLAVLALGMLGTGAELVLLEHYEDTVQWLPIVLLGPSLVLVAWAAWRPSRGSLLALRLAMLAFIVTGLLGLWYHYRGNMEFELEMDGALRGLGLVWESLRGATPALAPGTFVLFGLLGLLATYRHPALLSRADAVSLPRGEA